MKIDKTIICLLLCLNSLSGFSVESAKQAKQTISSGHQCTSDPCANTPTGEDPSEMAEREGRARSDQIRQSPEDSLRWKRIRLYSDSTKPERLQMIAHYQSRILMVLDPKSGNLSFRSSAGVHTFNVAMQDKAANNLCPAYNIQVINASSIHAVVRKTCPKFEYKPGQAYKSYEYYLYDRQTATMREIWSASAIENLSLLRSPTPEPSVSINSDGYTFQWKGDVASGGTLMPYNFNNLYTRQRNKSGKLELVCRDMTAGKHGEVESGLCEGGKLSLVQ